MKFSGVIFIAVSTMQLMVSVDICALDNGKQEVTRSFIESLKQERPQVPEEIKKDFELVLERYRAARWLPPEFKAEPLYMNKDDKQQIRASGSSTQANMALVSAQMSKEAVILVDKSFLTKFSADERRAAFGHELGHAMLHCNPLIDPQWHLQNALIAKNTIACGGPFALLASWTHLISSTKVSSRAKYATGALAVATSLAWAVELFGKPEHVRIVYGREYLKADYKMPSKATEIVCDILGARSNKEGIEPSKRLFEKRKQITGGAFSSHHPSPETRLKMLSIAKRFGLIDQRT